MLTFPTQKTSRTYKVYIEKAELAVITAEELIKRYTDNIEIRLYLNTDSAVLSWTNIF